MFAEIFTEKTFARRRWRRRAHVACDCVNIYHFFPFICSFSRRRTFMHREQTIIIAPSSSCLQIFAYSPLHLQFFLVSFRFFSRSGLLDRSFISFHLAVWRVHTVTSVYCVLATHWLGCTMHNAFGWRAKYTKISHCNTQYCADENRRAPPSQMPPKIEFERARMILDRSLGTEEGRWGWWWG